MTSSSWQDLIKDASSAGGGGFEPLPDGIYDLKIVEATTATTGKGKTMYKLKTEVQTGPHARRLVWDNLVVSPESPNAMSFFFRKMKALGLGHEFFATEPNDGQITSALVNRTFRGKLGTRTYNDKTSNEIQEYAPAANAGLPAGVQVPGAAPAAPPAAAPQAAPAAAPPASPWDNAPAAPPAAPAPGFEAPVAPF